MEHAPRPRRSQEARTRTQERLARMERRHQGTWSLQKGTSLLLFGALFVASPWLMFAVFDKDGWHTSPGLRALIVLAGLIAFGVCVVGYRARRSKLWRAKRRRPWWLLRFQRGQASSCAYCRDDLETQESVCPDCGATYHHECQAELGRCASLGCAGLGEAPQPTKPKVSLKVPA